MSDLVIQAQELSKVYKLYNEPIDRLKEAFHPFRKHYYHDFYALKDINFEIQRGETVGIIGKNGSGKSTLLKILSGVLTPSTGSYSVNGKLSSLLELGAGFNPEITGRENVYFNGTILGYTKEEINEKLNGIINFADIGEFIDQPVKTYSSGMSVRLAFAVAINMDPEILIIDEALSVGDINFQAKCYKKFNDFQKNGKTILFVTHDLNSVIQYCNKIIVLNDGKIIANTSPKEGVDIYKKIMSNAKHSIAEIKDDNQQDSAASRNQGLKSQLSINKHATIYGNNRAEIIDFGIFDQNHCPTQKLINGEKFYIKMKVRFSKKANSPIFAYVIKNIKGLEVTGTNTIYKFTNTGSFEKDEIVFIEFSQTLNMQIGQYALSLGCTNHEGDDFVVYNRLYDILLFEVISDKQMAGLYDLDSQINIQRL